MGNPVSRQIHKKKNYGAGEVKSKAPRDGIWGKEVINRYNRKDLLKWRNPSRRGNREGQQKKVLLEGNAS